MIVYRIPGWSDNFESAKSRTIQYPSHCYMPNKQHGLGMARIMDRPDGDALMGIWTWIAQACSQQRGQKGDNGQLPRDGWLTDSGQPPCAGALPQGHPRDTTGAPRNHPRFRYGKPWTAADLAAKFRRPVERIQSALDFFVSIDWMERLETEEIGRDTAGIPQYTHGVPLTEPNGTILPPPSVSGESRESPQDDEEDEESSSEGETESQPRTATIVPKPSQVTDKSELSHQEAPPRQGEAPKPVADGSWESMQDRPRFLELKAIVGRKLTASTWPGWKRLVQLYRWPAVYDAAGFLPVDHRFPDQAEKVLTERARQAPAATGDLETRRAAFREELAGRQRNALKADRKWTEADTLELRRKWLPEETHQEQHA